MIGSYGVELLRLDEQLGNIEWPEPCIIDVPLVRSGDCLVACAGFEDRSVEALHRVCDHGFKDFELILITYQPHYSENLDNSIRKICQDCDIRIVDVVYDRENPSGVGNEVVKLVNEFDRIFVDISGMSRLLIVQIVVALLGIIHRRPIPIVLLYSEARIYSPTKDQIEDDQNNSLKTSGVTSLSYMSSGIFEVATDPALSSVAMLGSEIRLVAFPSFDPIQLKNLIQELQPTYTDLVYGIRSALVNRWRKEAIRKLNRSIISTLGSRSRCFESSTLDYRETLRLLLEIYGERSMFDRILIAPTGSKMQAVAVGILRAVLYDVQIVYPTPREFTQPARYTLGVRRLYSVDLPVGEIVGLVSDQSVG